MIRKRILIVGAALLFSAVPAMAQHHGGGGHAGGGRPGGGSGGHTHSGGHTGGYYGGHTGGYYGGSSGGIRLSLGFGNLGYGYGGGGYGGGGYGGSYYRPSYSPGYIPSYSGPVPYLISPGVPTAPQYTYPELINPSTTLRPSIAPGNTIPIGAETGLKITDLYEGTAKTAGLRKGDIILKVNGVRTQSFEELRATLSTGKDKVAIEYIDATSGETDKKTVDVQDTKIGISVAETVIPKT